MYDQQRKQVRKGEDASKMPRKSCAYNAQAKNLQNGRKKTTKPTVEEVEDDGHVPNLPNLDACPVGPDASTCQHLDSPGNPELLDIIGALRGAAMVDDEDNISKSDSDLEDDDGDEEGDEIQEITALEQFTSTLQRAHDLAAAAEKERERGRK